MLGAVYNIYIPMIDTILTIVQVILAFLLTAAILIQQKGAGLGEAFGGTNSLFSTRRGVDLILHRATIVIAVLFFITALLLLVV